MALVFKNKDYKIFSLSDPRAKIRLNYWVHFLATGFGSGLLPKMPGTWGSIMALPVGVVLFKWLGNPVFIIFTIIAFALGCYLCQRTAEDMGVHDHGSIVWDEFVGIFITLWAVPNFSWLWLALAFLSFRFFDVLKPYPIRVFDEKLHSGFGIMIDDVLAGAYAYAVLWLLQLVI